LLIILFPALLHADEREAVRGWLDRMARAVDNLTYQGTLVYTRGNRLDTMRIYHRADANGVRERVVSLNGPQREVLRDANGVRCIFPGSQSMLIDTRITEPLFPMIPPDQVANASGAYQFTIGKRERVAELDAQIIHIDPSDQYRYGYRLWLERNTAMLLKSELLDENGQPLEQLMFAQISLGGQVSDSELRPEATDSGFIQVEIPGERHDATGDRGISHWRVSQKPAGFMLTSRRYGDDRGPGRMEHLVFTDGMASVSVYIEPVMKDTGHIDGSSRLGAVNIFGLKINGFVVTAVGEVPAATVKLMANSVVRTGLATR